MTCIATFRKFITPTNFSVIGTQVPVSGSAFVHNKKKKKTKKKKNKKKKRYAWASTRKVTLAWDWLWKINYITILNYHISISLPTTMPWLSRRSAVFVAPTVHAMTLTSRLELRRVGKAAFKHTWLFSLLLFHFQSCLVERGWWFITPWGWTMKWGVKIMSRSRVDPLLLLLLVGAAVMVVMVVGRRALWCLFSATSFFVYAILSEDLKRKIIIVCILLQEM